MKDLFSDMLSPEAWLIRETGWHPDEMGKYETNFTLGNGLLGSRGVLEEIPIGAACGTFFAGVFDSIGSQVPELVNAPNPFDFRIACRGEKLGVGAMDVLEHKRILDLRKAVLYRRTVYSNSRRKRFDYQSMRFVSAADPEVAVMQIHLTPLDEAAEFEITHMVDINVTNMGMMTEGRSKRHIVPEEVSKEKSADYLCVRTLEHEIRIAYAAHMNMRLGPRSRPRSFPRRVLRLHLKKGRTACFTKFFDLRAFHGKAFRRLKAQSLRGLDRAVKAGFDGLLARHVRAWDRHWKAADIDINGDMEVQKAIRFIIYHLIICGTDRSAPSGIGAKGLSGEGYRGHSFWDTEIFTLPFFIYTHPSHARHLLRYRTDRLDAARNIALGQGYQGAMFPWESAYSGAETTPTWHKDIDGTIKYIKTGFQEHHITADIAYGLLHYFGVTGDETFMLERGLELLLETARFWASRITYDARRKRYEINGVIGPDEFHEDVDNNAYTNWMVQWHLKMAIGIYNLLRRRHPRRVGAVARKIGFRPEETARWKKIRKHLANTSVHRRDGLIEQFEGFFRKRRIEIASWDKNGMPQVPARLRAADLNATQFVKQADVVLLMYLHPGEFSEAQKRKNYRFYERRTLHKSSLSLPTYAIMGLKTGDREKAYRQFLNALYTDLWNVHKNAHMGIHLACCGGAWQVLVNGFGGVTVQGGSLGFEPRLPPGWSQMRFPLKWRGFDLRVEVDRERIRLHFASRRASDALTVRVYGMRRVLQANRLYSFPRKPGKGRRTYTRDRRK